jgi:hypothetical protein
MLVLRLVLSHGLSPVLCLIPALLTLAYTLPGWFVANAGPWTYLVDRTGIQLRYGKSLATRVSPSDAPGGVVWEDNNIAEVELTTELGLPAIKLFATTTKGTSKHQMTVVYETEDAQVINKSVLPMIDKFRSKSKRKS